jgi:hypothetical protein
MKNEATATTNDDLTSKPSSVRRGPRKNSAKSGALIYCLEAGSGEGGKIQLSKPEGEDEILTAAFRGGVSYYRLQKFNAATEKTSEGLKIVGVPVE